MFGIIVYRVCGKQKQQRVAVGPGNAHFISILQVASDATDAAAWQVRNCCMVRRCCCSATLLLILHQAICRLKINIS